MPSTPCKRKELEKESSCLNRGGARFFIIHRISQFAKRNPNKEMGKRLKEIDRLTRYGN